MIQNKIVKIMSNLMEFRGSLERNQFVSDHIEHLEHFLRVLVEELFNRNLYTDRLHFWNMELFFQSAALHDIGKIVIRENILLKPEGLSPDEFAEVQKHTIYGENIISQIRMSFPESKLLNHAQVIAGTHHERWDGLGYPRRLAGEEIPLEGRFVALVDVFDTLISARPYKKALSMGEALKIIKAGRGSQFDPALTDAFLDASRNFHTQSAAAAGRRDSSRW
ncbi:MAG: HD domain-containing protein [Treponema sp.]|nr:HD domain-containing protein [Treponema sp.]